MTAEDQRGIFAARLREILNASDLSDDQKNTAIDCIGVWDVTGLCAKLVRMKDGNIDPTRLSDQIIGAHRDDPPVMVVFDPQASFGASEQAVYDNEQALLAAARRIIRELRCCVRFIHHTGKQNARDRTTDQYSGRGGSALPDGARMVAVLNYWDPDSDKDQPPTGCAATGGSSIAVLSRSKLSFSMPNLPKIWIKRTGYTFEHFTEIKRSVEEISISERGQVEAFLISGLKQGERYTQNDLIAVNEELRLSKHKIRAAIGKLKAQGRVIDADLPKDQKQGAKTKYLHPTAVNLRVAESGGSADTVDKNTSKKPTIPRQKNQASITVSAYREFVPDTVELSGTTPPFPHRVTAPLTQCPGDLRGSGAGTAYASSATGEGSANVASMARGPVKINRRCFRASSASVGISGQFINQRIRLCRSNLDCTRTTPPGFALRATYAASLSCPIAQTFCGYQKRNNRAIS